jgi:hypothetical protein
MARIKGFDKVLKDDGKLIVTPLALNVKQPGQTTTIFSYFSVITIEGNGWSAEISIKNGKINYGNIILYDFVNGSGSFEISAEECTQFLLVGAF